MKKCNIGGQAVLEGVMMKGPRKIAIAVRKQNQEIELQKEEVFPIIEKYPLLKLPVLRGIVSFVETMMIGVRTLTASAEMYGEGFEDEEEYTPSKFENFIAEKTGKKAEDVMISFAVVLAIAFAVLLFIIVPTFITNFLKARVQNPIVMNILEGIVRLIIFLAYIVSITRIKDIKRVFQYHGAEHKVVNCYEHDCELTVDNARKFSTLHPRCGTSFLLLVMLISIFVFSFLGWNNTWWIRMGSRILLLPIVAGFAYEVIKWAGRSESMLVSIISWPGMMLQKLTTREPDDSMLEVAITAFINVLEEVQHEQKDNRQDAERRGDPDDSQPDSGRQTGCPVADELCDEQTPHRDTSESESGDGGESIPPVSAAR